MKLVNRSREQYLIIASISDMNKPHSDCLPSFWSPPVGCWDDVGLLFISEQLRLYFLLRHRSILHSFCILPLVTSYRRTVTCFWHLHGTGRSRIPSTLSKAEGQKHQYLYTYLQYQQQQQQQKQRASNIHQTRSWFISNNTI